jgi:hypothetical protein
VRLRVLGFVIGGGGGSGWRALGWVGAGVIAVVFGVRLRHLGWPPGKNGGGLCALIASSGGGWPAGRGCACVYLVLGGLIGGIGSVGVWHRLWSSRRVGAVGGWVPIYLCVRAWASMGLGRMLYARLGCCVV